MECEKKDCIYQPMNVNCVNCGSKYINYQAEIARQSVTDGEIQDAIEHQEEMLKSQRAWLETFNNLDKSDKVDTAIKQQQEHIRRGETIIAALRAYKPEPDCASAEWAGGKCCGYGKSETDDEPIDTCKICPKQSSYEDGTDTEALRQYRKPEPCEWCDKAKLPEGFDFDTHSHFVIGTDLYHHDSNCGWEGEEIRYCPNCGRPLGGDRK